MEQEYKLEEFISLHQDYKKLEKVQLENNYNQEYRKKFQEFEKVIVNYGCKLMEKNPENKKIATVLLNSGIYEITKRVYTYLDESLRNDKYITLLALNGGLNRENYEYIGETLKNDREIMFLAAKNDNAGSRINTFYHMGTELLNDEDFLTNIFRSWGNTADLGTIKSTCEHYKIEIDEQKFNNAFHKATELNQKEIDDNFKYTSPYDSGMIDYFVGKQYELSELTKMFNEQEISYEGKGRK